MALFPYVIDNSGALAHTGEILEAAAERDEQVMERMEKTLDEPCE